MEQVNTLLVFDSVDPNRLIDTLSQNFSAEAKTPHRERRIYYDTFDWALYNSGMSLYRSSHEYSLRSIQDDRTLQTVEWKSNTPLNFIEAFSENVVSEKLKKVLAIRALLPRGRLDSQVRTIHILDEFDKTVLHVQVEKIRAGTASVINLVTLKPVRGYRKHHRQVAQLLRGIGDERKPTEVFKLLLGAAGETPGEYSSNMRVQLSPDMTARDATVIILERLLEVMRQNAPGITADIDTECLHDFRVAVRRTRSVLGQIKDVFPAESIKTFKKRFAELGQASNKLRDLDVFLLNKQRYEAMLPAAFRPQLSPLFKLLQSDRDKRQKEFVSVLKGRSCQSLLNKWETFLSSPTQDGAENPKDYDRPAIELARKYIFKRYTQVMALGGTINDSTPDEELHRLRIQCKNLRYLFEFFSSLFPQAKATTLIKQLKRLQDNLGEYNDLALQQSQLESIMSRSTKKQNENVQSAAATGGIIAMLHQRQQVVRKAFSKSFNEFSGGKNKKLYRELFA